MAEKFTEFMMSLAQDPQALSAFKARPEAAIKAAGLSAAERAVILSKDPSLIRKALTTDVGRLASESEGVQVIVVVL
jgi:hypothetical protein